MAELFLARSSGPGGFERLIVIKRLKPELAVHPAAVQAFLDEARIAATLQHANIVQVHDIELVDGEVSIAMEFLHGRDVQALIDELARAGETVPLDQAIAITLALCAGLHHAHERVGSDGKPLEIVHRDVSPHNVVIGYDGTVKLVDFGIARAAVRLGQTDENVIKGKPGYMAPEQITGAMTDRRTDVWATALVLYAMTVGRTPFAIGGAWKQLTTVVEQDPPPPSAFVPTYPAALEAIVMRGLAREPARRFATAAQLATALEDFARERSLDLSTFGIAKLVKRTFAPQLAAWERAQREGRSLAEHVAALHVDHAPTAVVDVPTQPPTVRERGAAPIRQAPRVDVPPPRVRRGHVAAVALACVAIAAALYLARARSAAPAPDARVPTVAPTRASVEPAPTPLPTPVAPTAPTPGAPAPIAVDTDVDAPPAVTRPAPPPTRVPASKVAPPRTTKPVDLDDLRPPSLSEQ